MKLMTTSLTPSALINNDNSDHLQQILSGLNSPVENVLETMKWKFFDYTINFSTIKTINETYPAWSQNFPINPVDLAKTLFLYTVNGLKSSTLFRRKFDSIAKTIFYLAERNLQHISKIDLEDYLSYILMHNIHAGLPVKRLTPSSFSTYSMGINIRIWIQILKDQHLPMIGFINHFADSTVTNALKKTIETLSDGDLTYRDWKEGLSFNHLTLDYGCYYVDHCIEFFNRHIGLAISLQRTLSQAAHIVKKAGLSTKEGNLKSFFVPVIGQFLAGKNICDLNESYRSKLQDQWWISIRKITLAIFEDNFLKFHVLEKLLSDQEIEELASKVGIKTITNNQREWLQHLVEIRCTQLDSDYISSLNGLRLCEKNCLIKTIGYCVDLEKVNIKIDEAYFRLITEVNVSLPTPEFFESIGITESSARHTFISNLIRIIEDAGIVQFVAITGWRESEFGFSLNDIKCYPNNDLLDQYACPVRYEIQWKVPKTNGDTKLCREITRAAYSCALRLAELVRGKEHSPCLYSFNGNAKKPNSSGNFIKAATANLWDNFARNYAPFNQIMLLDELNTLRSKMPLNHEDNLKFNNLSKRYYEENWGSLGKDSLLREAHRRITEELARVIFFLNYDLRRQFIWKYRTGNLTIEKYNLLNQYLSQETKNTIQSLNSEYEITPILTRAVVNEIVADCLYPTPHAFRHMWAEAVYRRFDGDAGWMIRSNFKHITQNMWLSYTRNKDNRRQHDRVKRQVISSLLGNYVRKKGAGFAGPMDKMLRRLFLHTKSTTIDALEVAVEQYGLLEIEDIKSNPWGFCILRKRGKSHAKCAEQGVPQRQNASPSLCLGCTNNLTQGGNVEGILLGISNDLKVLQNPKVPETFRRMSFQTVKNAHKQLKKLNVGDEYLSELEIALKIGTQQREAL